MHWQACPPSQHDQIFFFPDLVEWQKSMQYLLPLIVVQIMVALWLHYAALHKNLLTLQGHLASQIHWKDGVWVQGRGYSFYVCQRCTDSILEH